MHDRTRSAVVRQLRGMGCALYEVGVRHAERGMLNREWTETQIVHALDWLKRENFGGCDVYVRPARSTTSRLVLVDDLDPAKLRTLQAGPFAAAVTVQTSPGNYQAWIKLDADTSADVRREVARRLAREFDADPNSADSAHFGRLAGFTNRKPHHVDSTGRSPYVLLESYNGRPAAGAAELTEAAREALATEREQAQRMAVHVQQQARNLPIAGAALENLAGWYRELWNGLKAHFGTDFDASRADWMAAVAMFRKGYEFGAVADAIATHSPGIHDRKGSGTADYVTRTAGKAEIWHELKAQGVGYVDVADNLLSLAKGRAANRT